MTCASLAALSNTTSTRRSASRLRYSSARSSEPSGMAASSTPSARSKRPSASSGSAGLASAPRRLMNSCPSGNRARTRWATCTARVVLPTPPPPMTAITSIAVDRAAPSGAPANRTPSRPTASSRPVKSALSAGSRNGMAASLATDRGTCASSGTRPPSACATTPVTPSATATTSGAQPASHAAVWNSSRASPANASPSASRRTESIWGSRTRPRSSSRIVRELTPARSASCSWVSSA